MSYRNNLEAAYERAEASEREVARLKKELAAKSTPLEPESLEMPVPERFRIARDDGDVRVSWRWFSAVEHIFLLFFVIVWDGILVGIYVSSIRSGQHASLVFTLAHLAAGIGLTYSVLTGFLNRTTVRAKSGVLRVEHGPLPWRGNARLARDEIRQLYVNANTTTDSDNDKSTTYELCALLANGREKKLVKGIKRRNEAAYLEHTFERALGIAHAAVPGEA